MNDSFVETSIAPWLAVNDGAKAVAYYKEALGAADVYRLDGDKGSVAVAQLKIGQAVFWVQEDIASSPASIGQGSIRIVLTVNDPDALFDRAIAAGAKLVAGVHEEHGWRTGRVTDPFGHDWEFSKPLATRLGRLQSGDAEQDRSSTSSSLDSLAISVVRMTLLGVFA